MLPSAHPAEDVYTTLKTCLSDPVRKPAEDVDGDNREHKLRNLPIKACQLKYFQKIEKTSALSSAISSKNGYEASWSPKIDISHHCGPLSKWNCFKFGGNVKKCISILSIHEKR